MSPARAVWLACGLLLAAAVFACACGLPLIWDGAYQLAASLAAGEPFVYQTRFHTWFLWWPCVLLGRVTDDVTALTFAYGLPFIAAPAASLWLSWLVVRRHRPELVVWAAFGVAAAGLPGQVFIINDSVWQQAIFWPVFLGTLVPVSRRCAAVLCALAVFQLPHQAGILLLAAAFVAALVTGRAHPAIRLQQRWKAAAAGLLLLAAVAKAVWVSNPAWSGALHDSYAAQKMSWAELASTFRDGVLGLPLLGMLAMWSAAWGPLLAGRRDGGNSRSAVPGGQPAVSSVGAGREMLRHFAPAILGGVLWICWSADPVQWSGAINFRRWVIPFSAPFLAAALAAGCRRERPAVPASLALVPAAVFFIVITLQSLAWRQSAHRLLDAVAAEPRGIVPRDALPWIAGTPADHWGATALVALHGGRSPSKYLAPDESARALLRDGKIWLGHGPLIPAEPGPLGFFDHRPLAGRPGRR